MTFVNDCLFDFDVHKATTTTSAVDFTDRFNPLTKETFSIGAVMLRYNNSSSGHSSRFLRRVQTIKSLLRSSLFYDFIFFCD